MDPTSSPPSDNIHTQLDQSVINVLPKDCEILSVLPHGTSFFGPQTSRIDTKLVDGNTASFFLKVLSGKEAENMVRGEFESIKTIYDISPSFVPRPVAFGSYTSSQEKHFILLDFRVMTGQQPRPDKFAADLAFMHQKSHSPNGKFGFHVVTYPGNLPQEIEWEDSWETFFSKSLRRALDLEIKARGTDPDLEKLIPILFQKVIPRLLRPLEIDGRTVKPCLVHGDLWHGNAGVDSVTGQSLVFDACSFYAHNEYEFGQWRPACNGFGKKYLEAYQKHVEKSPPEEDYDGRLDLYKLRFNTHVSALFPKSAQLRDQMLGDIRDLVERYGDSTA